MFEEIPRTGETSLILTHLIEMQSLYLVWKMNFLLTEKKSRKKKKMKIIATSNPNENPTNCILVCHAGALVQSTELFF